MTLKQITDDIYQLRLPLPFALNHINSYLLRGTHGWTIVDTGINTPDAQQAWRAAFAELDIQPKDIEQVVLTHLHPDHFGLAGWLVSLAAEQGKAIPVRLGEQENQMFAFVWDNTDPHEFLVYLRLGGVSDAIIKAIADSYLDTLRMTYPRAFTRETLAEGAWVRLGDRDFTSIRTPGHSDGHIVFYDPSDQLALSGDHVLLTITPNIGLWTHTQSDPLGRYLHTLETLQALNLRLALPGHRAVITDWCARLQELYAHHQTRLTHALEAVEQGLDTGYKATYHIFDTNKFSHHEWRFAIAETLAHLEHLHLNGKLHKTEQDGVWHYALA